MSRVFLADGEKNLTFEVNVANSPTVEVISKTFKNLTDIIDEPSHKIYVHV